MKEIIINLIRGKKFTTFVDDEDYEFLMQWNWSYHKGRYTGYAERRENRIDIKMHRFIMNAKVGQIIDHIDGNGLNNQKSNLRFCTHGQNQMNRKSSGVSKYLGVHKGYRRNRINTFWLSQIVVNKNKIYLGSFYSEEEAALAYNNAAKKYHGEFARLNIFQFKENQE